MRKVNRPWPQCNQFQGWSGWISMSNFRPFFPCVPKKIPETPNLTCFTKSKWYQNEVYQQSVTKICSILKLVRIHQHAKLRPFLSWVLKKMPRNRQFGLFHLTQTAAKMMKINRQWPKSNQFSRWSEYISMSNFWSFIVTAIKKDSTLSLMSPQRLNEKVQLKKKCQKCKIAILAKSGTYVYQTI